MRRPRAGAPPRHRPRRSRRSRPALRRHGAARPAALWGHRRAGCPPPVRPRHRRGSAAPLPPSPPSLARTTVPRQRRRPRLPGRADRAAPPPPPPAPSRRIRRTRLLRRPAPDRRHRPRHWRRPRLRAGRPHGRPGSPIGLANALQTTPGAPPPRPLARPTGAARLARSAGIAVAQTAAPRAFARAVVPSPGRVRSRHPPRFLRLGHGPERAARRCGTAASLLRIVLDRVAWPPSWRRRRRIGRPRRPRTFPASMVVDTR